MNFLNLLLRFLKFSCDLAFRILRIIFRFIRRNPRRSFFIAVGFVFVVFEDARKILIGFGVILALFFMALNLIKKEIPGPIRSILGLGKKK